MLSRFHLGLVAVALAMGSTNAVAQSPVELGFDAVLGVTDHRPGPTEWFAAIPQRRLRVGIPASTRFMLEPNIATLVTHFDNITSWDLRLGLDLMYSLTGHSRVEPYIAAGAAALYQWGRTAGVSRQAGQGWIGGSAGMKMAVWKQMGIRTELHFDHGFGNASLTGFNQLLLRIGPTLLIK